MAANSATAIDFGIPELDELFGRPANTQFPGMSAARGENVSFCIYGADGTGKSVLALHLASRYAARHDVPVIYFSEDLGYQRAQSVFDSFGLHKPNERCEKLGLTPPPGLKTDLRLNRIWPTDPPSNLVPDPTVGDVAFVD